MHRVFGLSRKFQFYGCNWIQSVVFHKNVTEIGDYAFEDCTNLTSVIFRDGLEKIGVAAFEDCTNLTSVIFRDGLEKIGVTAFYGCTNLTSVVVPNSVGDIDRYSFDTSTTVYAFPVPYAAMNSSYAVLVGGPLYKVKVCTPHQESLEFTLEEVEYSPAPEGYDNLTAVEYGIIYRFQTFQPNEDGIVIIPNLTANTTYRVGVYTQYSDNTVASDYNRDSFATLRLISRAEATDISPTSATAYGTYNMYDAEYKDSYITFNGETIKGDKLSLIGLNPNTEYQASYTVTTQGGSEETSQFSFTTPELELETLQPRGVSESCAIVAAKTNISDVETSVGFQWRKYDAPESLKSNEGYAAIYDGQLEGYLKNLQPTSYYNVRAFYKAADDKYYYSDWVTFDPSDFSYFEPTVHTYPASDVAARSASVKGYVLAGTDDITSQGFEYWVKSSQEMPRRVEGHITYDESSPVRQEAAGEIMTILSSGQVMVATLDNLKPETTYVCRAFVVTQAGTTYGEEQEFTTDLDMSGIDNIATDSDETVEIIGYYDIHGRRYDEPRLGLNIVVYSDGTVKKVIVK